MFKKIYIEITNICNLKCKFCPDTNRRKEFINLENFEKIIVKIKDYTNLVCLHVKGEPLLHPYLHKILQILDKYKLKTNITTNGTLLMEKVEILRNVQSLRQVNISLHSINENEMFDSTYFENIFNSVNLLENVIVSYRLWNLQDISQNKINYNIINELENYYNFNNLKENLKTNEFIKIRENLFINQDLEFSWPSKFGKTINDNGRCLALKDQIAILVDGTVVPCCLDGNGDIPLGNILEETLEEILSKPKSQLIKKNFENSVITCELCKTCGFLKRLEDKRK